MMGWKITPFRRRWHSAAHLGPYVDWTECLGGWVDFEVGIALGPWIFALHIQGPEPDLADRMVETLEK